MFDPRRFLTLATFFALSSVIVQAHPGHDDGHELTWDFAHLAEHPWATTAWVALAGVAVCVIAQTRRRRTPVAQSLRGSQASRGK